MKKNELDGRSKVKHNKLNFIIFLAICSFIIVYQFYKMKDPRNIRANKDINSKSQMQVGTKESHNILNTQEYVVSLEKFGITTDGNNAIKTSIGINKALQYAKKQKYNKIILPFGEYSISETDPIIMVDNITFDLNGSTLRIMSNGLQKYTLINFTNCKNAKLINGILLGDRYTHDYNTIKGSHEWGCGVVFDDSEECELDNVTIKSFPGYGISSSLGKNISDLDIGVTKINLEVGNISEKGSLNKVVGTIRTIKATDISSVGDEFELGYNKGYMGYPFIMAKIFNSYFYDVNMRFICSSKGCSQYKKVVIPKDAAYVHFVFYQGNVPSKGDNDFESTTVFLTNYRSPYKIKITNCLIEDNRSLGMGLCGGRDFLIEGNIFKDNGGGAPGYAIDLEDGWEYMNKYVIRNNKFINNVNDVVVCAGDDILFEGNEFSSTVYMWGRATNYKFINNKFENIKQSINYEYTTDTVCSGNTYINCKIAIAGKNTGAKITIGNEKLINSSVNSMSDGVDLRNSIIQSDTNTSIRLAGTYRNCTINSKKGDYISARIYDSKIEDTSLNCQGDTVFKNCEIINSINNTTTNTKTIIANDCKFIDSKFIVSTWGNQAVISIESSEINMISDNKSFIDISAGKMGELTFKDNTVNNKTNRAVFNMFDTSYSVPNGKVIIEGNKFTQLYYPYIFDGVNITNGKFIINSKANKVEGVELLSGKYLNSKYFLLSFK